MNEHNPWRVESLGRPPKEQPELNAAELLGLRTRVVWKYICFEEPGCGNPFVPLVLLALARYAEANAVFFQHLSGIYGEGIQLTVDRLVREGMVERIVDNEGPFYRLKFFPSGYEKRIAAINDPLEYLRDVIGL